MEESRGEGREVGGVTLCHSPTPASGPTPPISRHLGLHPASTPERDRECWVWQVGAVPTLPAQGHPGPTKSLRQLGAPAWTEPPWQRGGGSSPHRWGPSLAGGPAHEPHLG